MNSSVKIWLTCAALLLGWNLPGIQGKWFNVPNPLIESDHLKNQSLENCAEKRFFTFFNMSVQPRKLDESTPSITVKLAWITTETIWYVNFYLSIFLDGEQIGATGSGGTNMCAKTSGGHNVLQCPIQKGKLYQFSPSTFPIPLVIAKGDYLAKGHFKNQDDAVILCFKAGFTWV